MSEQRTVPESSSTVPGSADAAGRGPGDLAPALAGSAPLSPEAPVDASPQGGSAPVPVAATQEGSDLGASSVSDAEAGGGRPQGAPDRESLTVPHTRTSATYIGVGIGLLVLVLVIIFIAQNLHEAKLSFLGVHFHMAVGLLVLASAVAGGLIVLLVSLARVLQLRIMARRHRQAHEA